MAEGNYKEMDKEFSLDDFDPKPVEKTTKQEETEPTENKKPESRQTTRKSQQKGMIRLTWKNTGTDSW